MKRLDPWIIAISECSPILFIGIFLWVAPLAFTGCATAPKTPSDNIRTASAWLAAHKQTSVDVLTAGGDFAFKQAVKPEDRKRYADDVWAATALWNSLAGYDHIVTTDELNGMLRQFAPSWNAEQYQAYQDAVSMVWNLASARAFEWADSKIPAQAAEGLKLMHAVADIMAKAGQNVARRNGGGS